MLRLLFALLLNLFILPRRWSLKFAQWLPFLRGRERRFVKLTLPDGLALSAKAQRLGPLVIGRGGAGPWWDFVDLIGQLAADKRVEGVYFKLDGVRFGAAEGRQITAQLERLRAAGKRIVCHMDQGALGDYLLATAADTILMSPPGRLYTFGLSLGMISAREALQKAGIEASFVHLGRFKTATHHFTRRRPTRPQTLMMRQLLRGLAGELLARVQDRRGLSPERARALLDLAPLTAHDARRLGFLDGAVYSDQIKETLEATGEPGREVALLTAQAWQRQQPPALRPLRPRRRPTVAVLHLKGTIMHDLPGGGAQLRQMITPKPIIEAISALRKDKYVKAVVLHIDSPGGSALASDLIWRQLRKLAQDKPLIASLGNVAASGGYYLAVAAHKIVAQRESLTGSIGVIAGKLSGGPLLQKLGVHIEHLREGAVAGFSSMDEPLGEAEAANLRRDIRAFYRRFLHRVWLGRGIPRRQLHRLARGRVYTGAQAHRVGLVDALGDLDDAIALACQEAHLDRADVRVRFVDHRGGGLKKMIQPAAALAWESPPSAPSLSDALVEALTPDALQPALAAALLLRQPAVLALAPLLATPGEAP
jgi:protease-4